MEERKKLYYTKNMEQLHPERYKNNVFIYGDGSSIVGNSSASLITNDHTRTTSEYTEISTHTFPFTVADFVMPVQFDVPSGSRIGTTAVGNIHAYGTLNPSFSTYIVPASRRLTLLDIYSTENNSIDGDVIVSVNGVLVERPIRLSSIGINNSRRERISGTIVVNGGDAINVQFIISADSRMGGHPSVYLHFMMQPV